MRNLKTAATLLLCVGIVAGCSGNSVFGTNNPTAGNPILTPTNAVLQISVGTLNDAAGTWNFLDGDGGAASTYLNSVSTFRQSNGNTAFTNTGDAILSGPVGFASFVDGTQSVDLGALRSYGQDAGVNAVTGLPPTYPAAGAPAAGFPTGFLAERHVNPLGNPQPGLYSIALSIKQNGVTTPFNASATLPVVPRVLGPWAGPPVFTADVSHDGGGTFTLAPRPTFVTETLVVVLKSCPGGLAESNSVETTSGTALLPPGSLPALCPDFVNAATYFAFAIGADYPLVESGPPASASQTPTIGGSASGTANLTFSGLTSGFTP